MTSELPPRIISGISFVGRGGGWVKALDGFRKGHHTVPDAANAVTNGFLAKIAHGDLAAEAETLFQQIRTQLGYKRKDLSLAVAAGVAVFTARDFSLEIAYALEEADPARYAVTTTLRQVASADLVRSEGFETVFRGKFSAIAFAFARGAQVESVIDVIEGLERREGLSVSYPSDCRECVIGVEGVDAIVRCTAAALEMEFPRAGSPRELVAAFEVVRGRFSLHADLSGLMR